MDSYRSSGNNTGTRIRSSCSKSQVHNWENKTKERVMVKISNNQSQSAGVTQIALVECLPHVLHSARVFVFRGPQFFLHTTVLPGRPYLLYHKKWGFLQIRKITTRAGGPPSQLVPVYRFYSSMIATVPLPRKPKSMGLAFPKICII